MREGKHNDTEEAMKRRRADSHTERGEMPQWHAIQI